jgi:hypothetical protein
MHPRLQDGCVNSTTGPMMQRCWPLRNFIWDVAVLGADYDAMTDTTIPNKIAVWMVNTTLICDALVDQECLLSNPALVCYVKAERQIAQAAANAAPSSSSSPQVHEERPQPATPPGVNGPGNSTMRDSGGTGALTGDKRIAAIVGGVAGADERTYIR